jgi:hypothetical protein
MDFGYPKSITCFLNILKKKMPGGENRLFCPYLDI